jgi:UDP-glucose 4-epimerase
MAIRKKRRETIVLTGISSRLGRRLARALHRDYQIIGLDARGCTHIPKDVTVHTVDLRSRRAEDIFRRNRVDAVVHMNPEWSRHDLAASRGLPVVGTHKVLDYCQAHDVPKVVVLSAATVYGAHPDNNQFLTEEAPLLAGQSSSTLRDLVEVDMYAQSFFWRHPEIDTVLLRPVHIVGDTNNPSSRYLRGRVIPTLLGFDPMVQLLSPDDLVDAIALSLKPGIRGVFNIAGPGPAPLSAIIEQLHRPRLPVPEPVARAMLGVALGMGFSGVPGGELDFLKYVCMVDDSRAREVLRYRPQRSLDEILSPLRA